MNRNINNKQNFFLFRHKKTILHFTMVFLLAIGAIGMLSLVKSDVNNNVSAQESQSAGAETLARADMLSFALNFKTAADYSVFGGNGVIRGNSVINGKIGDPVNSEIAGSQNRADLNNALSAINQLPCKSLANPRLGGETFTPGVYCLNSANIDGELMLNGNGDKNAIFVFRIEGDLTTATNSRISLLNEAFGGNIFFVSNNDVDVAANTRFEGNIVAKNNINIQSGSFVSGRVLSINGTVEATDSQIEGSTGVLQICKFATGPSTGSGNLLNRIFRFQIGGTIYEAPVGGCTGPITLPVGPVVINELIDGRIVGGGTFTGRFRLVDVNSPTPGALGAVNLPLRTANVFIREGTISNQTVVNFVNTFAVNAIVEICKRAAPNDPDIIALGPLGGFFDFTIDALDDTTITVPVGQCSGPIQVNVPTSPGPVPQPAIVNVTEIGRTGFTLESATTFAADRFISLTLNGDGGGTVRAFVLEGGAASQTTINFFNRTNPGLVKVCKIAGPGIPDGAIFRFTVTGTGPSNDAPGVILPGVPVTRIVDVVAGPASQGGFCNFVRTENDPNAPLQRFIVGTNVTVTETANNLILPPNSSILVSRIRVNQLTTGFSSNLANRTVTFQARRETREAEFVNIFFRPTLLKICKVAGSTSLLGQSYTFDVVINDEGGLTPGLTVPAVTVQAGPAAQGGFCAFAQGPYTATATTPPVGTFRVGSTVTVTERASAGSRVSAIISNTGTPSNVNLTTRSANLVLGTPGGFNEIQITNVVTTPVVNPAIPFDFDGDRKSDISVNRPASGNWYILGSSTGFTGVQWGTSTDILTPADYDGDGKTDVAVFRSGAWYILGSSSGFRAISFGQSGDIPQPGDFDGDGKADISVFRPSTGAWYRLNSEDDSFFGMTFGQDGDRAIAADYDGDGKTDIAVRRGEYWYIQGSTSGFTARQFGYASDIPVPADYDGDRKVDIAVYRGGAWYILASNAGYYAVNFGNATDSPIPADYDGDGKADITVFRGGNWFMLRSTESVMSSVQFGAETDKPIPGSYLR